MNKAPYPVVPRSTNKFEFQQPDRRDKKERGDHMDSEHKDAAADSENEAVDRERCGTLPQRSTQNAQPNPAMQFTKPLISAPL